MVNAILFRDHKFVFTIRIMESIVIQGLLSYSRLPAIKNISTIDYIYFGGNFGSRYLLIKFQKASE